MTPQDRIAVVTGGGSGIGRACLEALSLAGYVVVCADVSDAGGEAIAELEDRGHSGLFVRTDMSRPTEIDRLFARTRHELGRVDVLVNNAAITRVIDFFDVTAEDWSEILEVNARGYFLAMQQAARIMSDTGGGSIVNLASIAGKGFRDTTNIAYASSKGAVITMTRIAAARLGPLGIRVNAVCPGMTKTEMWNSWIDGRSAAMGIPRAQLQDAMAAKVPLNRLNEPSDIADCVLFLASDASRMVTGQSINVDGGMMWD